MSTPDAVLAAFVDDASALTEVVPVAEALRAFDARAGDPRQGTFVVRDTDLPHLRGFGGDLTVVVTGGAGQVAGPAGLCSRLGLHLVRLHITLRDPGDLRGNARRVVAAVGDARTSGALDENTQVCLEVPGTGSEAGWLDAADEVGAAEHGLALRLDDGSAAAGTLVSRIDASLDRETPFTLHGLSRCLPHGDGLPGALNVLVATQLLFDGGADPVGALAERDVSALLARTTPQDLARARRWFTSFASEDVKASLHELSRVADVWTTG